MRAVTLMLLACLASCDPSLTPPTIEVTLGTHQAGDVFGDTFEPLEPGGDLAVVLGTQHSWMVVVGAELGALPPEVDEVGFACTLTAADGTVLGTVRTERRAVSAKGVYLLNVFVVVPDELSLGERLARLELVVTAGDAEGRAALDVRLVGEGR